MIQHKQVTNILQYKPILSYNQAHLAEINTTAQLTFKIPPNSVMIIILRLAEIN
jgi:hypothetical protein